MGCGVCVGVCPTKSLEMVPAESRLEEQTDGKHRTAQDTII